MWSLSPAYCKGNPSEKRGGKTRKRGGEGKGEGNARVCGRHPRAAPFGDYGACKLALGSSVWAGALAWRRGEGREKGGLRREGRGEGRGRTSTRPRRTRSLPVQPGYWRSMKCSQLTPQIGNCSRGNAADGIYKMLPSLAGFDPRPEVFSHGAASELCQPLSGSVKHE